MAGVRGHRQARTAIRQQLKQLEHEDAVRLGHHMLDRALGAAGHLAGPAADPRARGVPRTAIRGWAMLADIALGNRMPVQVALALAQEQAPACCSRMPAVPQDAS